MMYIHFGKYRNFKIDRKKIQEFIIKFGMSLEKNSFNNSGQIKEKMRKRDSRKSHLQLNRINWQIISQLSSLIYARVKKINQKFISTDSEDCKPKASNQIQDQKQQKIIKFSTKQDLHGILDIQYSEQILEETIYAYLEIMASNKGILGTRIKNLLKKYGIKDRKNRRKILLKNKRLYRYAGDELFQLIALSVENSIHPTYHGEEHQQFNQSDSLKNAQSEESSLISSVIYNDKLQIPLISELDQLEKQWIGLDFFNNEKIYDWEEIQNDD